MNFPAFFSLWVCEPLSTEDATMDEEKEEVGDAHTEMRRFPLLWPLPRSRSKSDTSGFRAKVLCRLRGARSGMINRNELMSVELLL